MDKRTSGAVLALLAAVGLLALAAGCGGGGSSQTGTTQGSGAPEAQDAEAETASGATAAGTEGPSGEPIVIGFATAQTGFEAPYDTPASQAFQMRMGEINAEGGILGRPVEFEWIDTKSDKPTAATAAVELLDKGADVIIGTCDFDYSAPAISVAQEAGVPGFSVCASSPKAATPSIYGDLAGSMGEGSDTEGVTVAEFLRDAHPEWTSAFVFKDTSIEYSKATADYFAARWQELGGEICGQADFVGGENTDVSAQVTRLRGLVDEGKCDVIFVGSWVPPGAVVVRQVRDAGIDLPIAGNNAVDGTLLTDVAGPVSNFFSIASVCIPSYCSGEENPAVAEFFEKYKEEYGEEIPFSYPTRGYDLASAVAAAIETAGSTEGQAIADALWNLERIDTLAGPVRFTPTCHRPQPASHSVLEWTDGKATAVTRWAVTSIPDIGDGNPCAGEQLPVPSGS